MRSHDRDFQQEISSFIIHDKSNDYDLKRYKKGIISDSHFVKSELNKLRNPNFPICYSKFEDSIQIIRKFELKFTEISEINIDEINFIPGII